MAADAQGQLIRMDRGTRDPEVLPHRHSGPVTALAFSPEGRHWISAAETDPPEVWVHDWENGKVVYHLPETRQGIAAMEVSPDGRILAVLGRDGLLKLWRILQPVPSPTVSYTGIRRPPTEEEFREQKLEESRKIFQRLQSMAIPFEGIILMKDQSQLVVNEPISFDPKGVVFRNRDGQFTPRIPWTEMEQESLRQLIVYPKALPYLRELLIP